MLMKKHQTGFTMVELLVAVAVFALLAAFAIPSFKGLVKGNQLSAATNNMIGAIQYARSEAAVRGVPVKLCNARKNLRGCQSATTWGNSWAVVDGNSQKVIRVFANASSSAVVVKSPGGKAKDLVFKPNGSIDGFLAGTGTKKITFTAKDCPSGKPFVRDLDVSFLGRVRSKTKNCP